MSSNHNKHHSHVTTYVIVFISLLLLTALTVYTATNQGVHHYLGGFAIYLAMLIATIKASLVAFYFMHLKEDNNFNKLVFTSALVFLFIFVALTLSDIWTRPSRMAYAKVNAIEEPEGSQLQKMNDWRVSSSAAIERGKTLYSTNCLTCHGATGMGDGPSSTAMNPKPRNFTSTEGWKNGRAPSEIFKTLKEGILATGMPPQNGLPAEDRWALVHYIRTLSQNPPNDTPASLAAIGLGEGAAATASKDPNAGVQIPVSFAIERLIQEASKK